MIYRLTTALLSVLVYASISVAEELPVEYFSRLPMFSQPKLSPDGKWLAGYMVIDDEVKLVTLKLLTEDDPEPAPITPISSGKFEFASHRWVNNERLMVKVRQTKEFDRDNTFYNIAKLATIKKDGTDVVYFSMTPNEAGLRNPSPTVLSVLPQDPDHVIAQLDLAEDEWGLYPEVDLLNINTGDKKRLVKNTKQMDHWLVDSNGDVRLGYKVYVAAGDKVLKVFYRESVKRSWQLLYSGKTNVRTTVFPIRFHPEDANILLVSKRASFQRKRLMPKNDQVLFEYNIAERSLGSRYVNSAKRALIKTLKKAVGEDRKLRLVSESDDKKRYIVRVGSDREPMSFYLLDLTRKSFDLVGASYPDLMNKPMAAMEQVSYVARDGMTIPAFLTKPVGAQDDQALPLIVYPHGGPWQHDRYQFNNYVQFFVNRGYAVLQPQFRGSTGQGQQHERAGYGQWGQAMQDDITDGVQWLIAQGEVDAKRICIVGSSYGGYAVTMGMVKTPDLYRCGISINGVQDLVTLREEVSEYSEQNAAKIIDKKRVRDYSPYHQAKRITRPLLIIGSELDAVVPIAHSERLYKKMQKLDKNVQYLKLNNGEHWRTNQPAEDQKFKAMDAFLKAHLAIKEE